MTSANAGDMTFADIEAARRAISGQIIATPTLVAAGLSDKLNLDISLKLESQQYTGSFKPRGALNRLLDFSEEQKRKGVIANSAGNHAQGVAFRAKQLGIPATIVMPEGTPATKIDRTARHGARVVLYGDGLEAAGEYAQQLVESEGLTLVPPYDDPRIVAGQATVAQEMLEADPDLETLVIPIGGGGLCGGMALAAKTLKPSIRIVGVQTKPFASMYNAVKGASYALGGATIAEGIAIKKPGKVTRPLIERYVDDIVVVEEGTIEQAIYALMKEQKIVAEGAGAAGVAALMTEPAMFTGQKLGVVICGGNIDSRLMSSILMRGLVTEGQLVRLRIVVPDSPGMLARATTVIGKAGGNVVEVQHQRLFHNIAVKQTEIDFLVETRDRQHVRQILAGLEQEGVHAEQLDATTAETKPTI